MLIRPTYWPHFGLNIILLNFANGRDVRKAYYQWKKRMLSLIALMKEVYRFYVVNKGCLIPILYVWIGLVSLIVTLDQYLIDMLELRLWHDLP